MLQLSKMPFRKVAELLSGRRRTIDITVKSYARGNVEQISELENLVVSSAYGLQNPLKEVAEVKMGVGPQTIIARKASKDW